MGDQADALGYAVHQISSIEIGKTLPSEEYIEKLSNWLNLNEQTRKELKKRAQSNVINFPIRNSTANNSSSMRLFRRISKLDPNQIRDFRKKLDEEVGDDR